MGWRGVHFAIDDVVFDELVATIGTERADYIANVVEENWDANFATETDKAWSLIHSALQGSDPEADDLERAYNQPASWAILGRDDIFAGPDYLIGHVPKDDVSAVADLLSGMDANELAERLNAVIQHYECANVGAAEVEYAAGWFPKLQEFYQRASVAGRHVIFTVDF